MQSVPASLCNGDGECMEHSSNRWGYDRMYECYFKCKLKKCQRCYTYHPQWYLRIYDGFCRDCYMDRLDKI